MFVFSNIILLIQNFLSLIKLLTIYCNFSAAPAPGQSTCPGARPSMTAKRPAHTGLIKVIINTLVCRYWISGFQSVTVMCRDRHFVQVPMSWKDRKKYSIKTPLTCSHVSDKIVLFFEINLTLYIQYFLHSYSYPVLPEKRNLERIFRLRRVRSRKASNFLSSTALHAIALIKMQSDPTSVDLRDRWNRVGSGPLSKTLRRQ